MALTPALDSVEALYRKMERELYRTFHSSGPLHKADHFFNFCVTSHSMQDFLLERLGKVQTVDQQPFRDSWNADPLLVAVADVANTAKHNVLRSRGTRAPRVARTKRVRPMRSLFIDIYKSDSGAFYSEQVKKPDLSITLGDGRILDAYQFMTSVLKYWREYLSSHGIRVRRQPISRLGKAAT